MPTIASIAQHASRVTDVMFSGVPDETYAETVANWSATNGLVITGAERMVWNATVVRLTHSRMTEGQSYSFTANGNITGAGNSSGSVTSAIATPSDMTLVEVISRDSQHTDFVFSYEVADAYLSASHLFRPNTAAFVSATKQADPRIVRVKHANVPNGTYGCSVSASLASVYGEVCTVASASVVVSLQHDTTSGLKMAGVYGGKLLGCGPTGDVRMAYVTAGDGSMKLTAASDASSQPTKAVYSWGSAGTVLSWKFRVGAASDGSNVAWQIYVTDASSVYSGIMAYSGTSTTKIVTRSAAGGFAASTINLPAANTWITISYDSSTKKFSVDGTLIDRALGAANVKTFDVRDTSATDGTALWVDDVNLDGTVLDFGDPDTWNTGWTLTLGGATPGTITRDLTGTGTVEVERATSSGGAFTRVNTVYPSGSGAWAANTLYSLGTTIEEGGRTYTAIKTVADSTEALGRSHATTEPTWPTTPGATVTDNEITWQENTSVTVTSITEDGNVVNLIHDRRPAYRSPSIALGATAYYKARYNGAAYSNEASVVSQVDKDAQRSLRLYKWRTVNWYTRRYTYSPMFYDPATFDVAVPQASFQPAAELVALAYAYKLTGDGEFLWFAQSQLTNALETLEYDAGHRLIIRREAVWPAGLSFDSWDQDIHFRTSYYTYLAAKLLEQEGATTLAGQLYDDVDAWTTAALTHFIRDVDVNANCVTAALGSATNASVPIFPYDWCRVDTHDWTAFWPLQSSDMNAYGTFQEAGSATGADAVIFNKIACTLALCALLYGDVNSLHYHSTDLLALVNDNAEMFAISVDPYTGELQYGTNGGTYTQSWQRASSAYAAFSVLNMQIAADALGASAPAVLATATAGYIANHLRDYPTWQTGETVAVGAVRIPTSTTSTAGKHFIYVASAITTGITGGSEPTWPTAQNGTVVDGGVTWKARQSFTSEPLLDGDYPNVADGDQRFMNLGNYGLSALLMKLTGEHDAWSLKDLDATAAYVDPETLQIAEVYKAAAGQYSPSGYPLGAGGAASATYYDNGNEGAYLFEREDFLAAVFAPNEPSGLTATLNAGSVDLAWTDNSTDETAFSIEEAHDWVGTDPADGDWTLVATTDPNATTYSDTTPPAATKIRYRVAAFTGAMGSLWAESNDVSTILARALYYRLFVC